MKINTVVKGDALRELRKLPDSVAQSVITDPPYFNVLQNEEWDTQWTTPDDYLDWCDAWTGECLRILRDDGLCFIFGQLGKREHTFIHLMSRLCMRHQFHDLLIWDRVVGYNERRDSFTPQCELALVLRKTDKVKFNKGAVREPYDPRTIEVYMRDKRYKDRKARREHLSKGKHATHLLRVPSLKGSPSDKWGHPSQKPVQLIEKLVACSTDPDDLVLDPFLGSGTTAVAAESSGRRWIGFERNPRYVKIARQRIAQVRAPKQALVSQ